MRRVAAPFLLLVLLLPSLAAADHVYSHRYLVFGRVVDDQGRGVPGIRVELAMSQAPEGPCALHAGSETEAFGVARSRGTTDANGTFLFCQHVHALSRSAPPRATLSVPARGLSDEFAIDVDLRADFRTIVLDDAAGSDAAPFIVAGRAWREDANGSALVEQVRVFGRTVDRAPVVIEVVDPGATGNATAEGIVLARIETATNAYGDFAVPLEAAPPASASVRVTVQNETFEANVSNGWATVKARFDAPDAASPATTTPAATPPPTGAGSGASSGARAAPEGADADAAPLPTTRRAPGAGVLAIALAAAFALALVRRQRL